jgi:DNA repair protein RadC
MLISDMPRSDRPREKLLARGVHSLSDVELLALFLRTGQKGLSAVDLAQRWLQQSGGLRCLLAMDFNDAKRIHGLGLARFAELQGALELGRRVIRTELQRKAALRGPNSVVELLQRELRDRHVESFAVAFLDSQLRLISLDILAQGTQCSVPIHPRQVLETALRHRAHALILAHNHPSGSREPSQQDIELTQRIHAVLSIVDIRLLDHIIVADGPPVSLAELGRMP